MSHRILQAMSSQLKHAAHATEAWLEEAAQPAFDGRSAGGDAQQAGQRYQQNQSLGVIRIVDTAVLPVQPVAFLVAVRFLAPGSLAVTATAGVAGVGVADQQPGL